MKKTWNVLISAPYMLPVVQRFRPQLEQAGCKVIVPDVNERLEEKDILNYIAEIDGTICGDDRYTRRVLQQAPRLKVISKWGTGIDSIDRQACADLGIRVCNTPNAFTQPVADSVFAYMLSFARKTHWMDQQMKSNQWEKIPGITLGESTLGIIGMGNIGKEVARRAAAFGMNVLGNDIVDVDPHFLSVANVKMTSLDDLLSRSDFVSLHTDLNKTSQHLMNEKRFAKMKKNAVLINTSRGPAVDEKALVSALQKGHIAGAALDVFEHEPLPASSPLMQMNNVMLAPHNSNSSPRAWERVHVNSIKNLVTGLIEVQRASSWAA